MRKPINHCRIKLAFLTLTAFAAIAVIPAVAVENGQPDRLRKSVGALDLPAFSVSDFPIPAETTSAITVHVHPAFDPVSLANDVAVLEFPSGNFWRRLPGDAGVTIESIADKTRRSHKLRTADYREPQSVIQIHRTSGRKEGQRRCGSAQSADKPRHLGRVCCFPGLLRRRPGLVDLCLQVMIVADTAAEDAE